MTITEQFVTAPRVHQALTAAAEKRALLWLAKRAPVWVSSDQLTALGLLAQVGAGVGYWLARYRRGMLWLVIGCLVLNWLGDSLDGTLARVRQQPRPRFGFYVDHIVDVLGSIAMMTGLACSGLVYAPVAIAMLLAFLVLAAESYLATYTLGRFELSQGLFGPTEIRLLLVAANLKCLHSPWVTVLHHRLLLFDLGGTIGTAGMLVVAATTIARHTLRLYREEPLP
jgi:phosphatidylglycerophosphate synthase